MKHLTLYHLPYNDYLKSFEKMLVAKNYSLGKNSSLIGSVQEFLFYLETKQIFQLSTIKAITIVSYHQYLVERPNQRREGALSDCTVRSKLYAIRLLFDFLVETNHLDNSPARIPKFTFGEYNHRNIITCQEVKELYSVCQTKRDKALLSIAYGCGLRRSELVRLNITDINLSKGVLTVNKGKNGKSRIIPLSDKVISDIREYLIYERDNLIQNNPQYMLNENYELAFFINNIGTRKQGLAMNNRLKMLIDSTQNNILKQKSITLHCLRHSIATYLIDKGMDILFVQKFLGHSLMDTTHLYSKRRKQKLHLFK